MPPSHCAAHVGLHGNHVHASADASPALEPAARGAGQADRVASGAVSTPLFSSPGRSTTGHNQGEDTEDPAAAALLPAALLPAAECGSLAPSALPYLLLPLAQAQLLPSAVWRPEADMAHSHTYVLHSHTPLAELRPHTPALAPRSICCICFSMLGRAAASTCASAKCNICSKHLPRCCHCRSACRQTCSRCSKRVTKRCRARSSRA